MQHALHILNLNARSVLIPAILLYTAIAGQAAIIAADSFWTTGTQADPQYLSGSRFNQNGNADVTVGTTGFSATNTWNSATGTILPTTAGPSGGLTHNLLSGTARAGSAGYSIDYSRDVSRQLDTTIPVSSTYFLSGLVHTSSNFAANGNYLSMGFSSGGIGTGMHLGFHRDSGGSLQLAAFGGGSIYDLGAASLNTTYMIVLELTANASGADSLNAWIAADGGSLSQALTNQSLETFSGVSDFGTFRLQRAAPDGATTLLAWADEMRMGTSFSDVALIPEPSSLMLCSIGIAGIVCRRRRN